jgi:hypothetical protein
MPEHEPPCGSEALVVVDSCGSRLGDKTEGSRTLRLERYLSSARYDRNGRQQVDDDLSDELDQYVFPPPSKSSGASSSQLLQSSGTQLSASNISTTSNAPHLPPLTDDRDLLASDTTFVPLPSFASSFPEYASDHGPLGLSADIIQAVRTGVRYPESMIECRFSG